MVTTTRKFKGTRAYTNVIKVAFYLVSELVFDQGGEKRIQPILRAINGPIFDEYNCQWLDVIDSYANRLLYIIRLLGRANTGCAVLGPLREKIFWVDDPNEDISQFAANRHSVDTPKDQQSTSILHLVLSVKHLRIAAVLR